MPDKKLITINNIIIITLFVFIHFVVSLIYSSSMTDLWGHDAIGHLDSYNFFFQRFLKIIHNSKLNPLAKIYYILNLFEARNGISPANWPRFTYFVTTLLSLIFGKYWVTILISNAIFLLILSISLFYIVKIIIAKDLPAYFTIIFALTSISIGGISRTYTLDFPLTCMVTAGIAALIATNRFSNKKYSIIFGIISGLGILTKAQFAFFLWLPILITLLSGWKNFNKIALKNFVISIVIILFITLPWWFGNLDIIGESFLIHLLIDYNKNLLPVFKNNPGFPKPFPKLSLPWFTFYLIQLPFNLTPWWTVLLFIYIIWGFRNFLKKFNLIYLILLSWFFGALFILTLMSAKETRFSFPF